MHLKVKMLEDRARSALLLETLTLLRNKYIVCPGGPVSVEVLGIGLSVMRADVPEALRKVLVPLVDLLNQSIESFAEQCRPNCRRLVQDYLSTIEEKAAAEIHAKLVEVLAIRDAELSALQEVISARRLEQARRRELEEKAIRERLIELGRLLECQRASTHEIRKSIQNGRQQKILAHRSDPIRPAARENVAKRLSQAKKLPRKYLNPLSEGEIRELYGGLPTHMTSVEELSKAELDRLARHQDKPFIAVSDALMSDEFSPNERSTLQELRRLRISRE
jgi:hypothetical protein